MFMLSFTKICHFTCVISMFVIASRDGRSARYKQLANRFPNKGGEVYSQLAFLLESSYSLYKLGINVRSFSCNCLMMN